MHGLVIIEHEVVVLFEEGSKETEDVLPIFGTFFASVQECKGDCRCHLISSNKPVSGRLDHFDVATSHVDMVKSPISCVTLGLCSAE